MEVRLRPGGCCVRIWIAFQPSHPCLSAEAAFAQQDNHLLLNVKACKAHVHVQQGPAVLGLCRAPAAWPRHLRVLCKSSAVLSAGRSETMVEYDVGFKPSGEITALSIRGYFLCGAFLDLGFNDMMGAPAGR